MKKITLIAFAASALAGCATASDTDRQAAMQASDICLLKNARELDDRISNAATIGQVVETRCVDTLRQELLVRAGPIPLDSFTASFWASAESRATQAVLMARRGL